MSVELAYMFLMMYRKSHKDCYYIYMFVYIYKEPFELAFSLLATSFNAYKAPTFPGFGERG